MQGSERTENEGFPPVIPAGKTAARCKEIPEAHGTTVKEEDEHKPDGPRSSLQARRPEEGNPCIEYLQRAIARLLMKNEAMRFELLSIGQKIAVIEQTVFGADRCDLRQRLPPGLLGALRDLCRGRAAAGEEQGMPYGLSSERAPATTGSRPGACTEPPAGSRAERGD